MAVIWGLDLREIQWSKFKSSYMWSRKYHLRRTRFIVYQLAMICCVVSESLGTAALSDYIDQQEAFEKFDDRAVEYNNDIVGIGSYNIFGGVFVATIFGAAFFFDLFWPERYEPKWVKNLWIGMAIFACFVYLAAAIGLTVIILYHCAYVTGVDANQVAELLRVDSKVPLCYRHSNRSVSSVAFSWPGWVAVVASTVVMWLSQKHDAKYGPLSTNARNETLPTSKDQEANGTIPMHSPEDLEKTTAPVPTNGPVAHDAPVGPPGPMDRWERQNEVAELQKPPQTYAGT